MAQTIRFNRKYALPNQYDPYRRLVAAVAVFALMDYLAPPKKLPNHHRHTAREFCQSEIGRDIFMALDISPHHISSTLGDPS